MIATLGERLLVLVGHRAFSWSWWPSCHLANRAVAHFAAIRHGAIFAQCRCVRRIAYATSIRSRSRWRQPLHRQLGMTDDELAAVVDELGREPTDLELAMYSVMWSEHCSYKSSRAHLGALPDRGAVGARRPGRGRGRRRHRRRARDRGAHREPQPSVGGRALPGRGDRRRRHHPRHLLDGRAPDRADGSAAVRHRSTTRAPATCSKASCRASAATATRSACRRSAARPCSTTRTATTRS